MNGRRPPRWFKALSIALGIASIGLAIRVLAGNGALPDAPEGLAGRIAVLTVVFHLGYFTAPFLVGRGSWASFFGGVLLTPAVLGWLLLYWPGLMADRLLAGLGIACLAVLAGLLGYAFRDFFGDFQGARRSARPD